MHSRTRSATPWLGAIVLAVLAIGLRLVNLDHTPHYDEFYHILAAQSLLHEGDLCIANCLQPYDRAAAFTYLVAGSFQLFGETLAAARLPSVLLGAVWVAAVYLWTRHAAGRVAGWAAGLLLLFDPGATYLSQLARLYILHAVAFWLGATGVYLLTQPGRPRRQRLALSIGTAAAFLLALHLQITTLIGLAAVALWTVGVQAPTIVSRLRTSAPWRWTVAILVVLALALTIALVQSGSLAQLWQQYQWTNLWPSESDPSPGHFHDFFLQQYEWMWQLFPLAALVALRRSPRAASFCLTIFATVLVLHSFGGFKAFRVIYYGVPFLLATWAIALSAVVPAVIRLLQELASRLLGSARPLAHRIVIAGAMALLLGYIAVSTESFSMARQMLVLDDSEWPAGNINYRGAARWGPAMSTLRPIADSVDAVVVTSANKAHWFLGRVDAAISENQMFDGYGNFAPDLAPAWQDGVPLFRTPETMTAVFACYPSGLLVIEPNHWRRAGALPPEVADVIEQHAVAVPLPDSADLMAFRWQRPMVVEAHGSAPTPPINCSPPPLARAAGES